MKIREIEGTVKPELISLLQSVEETLFAQYGKRINVTSSFRDKDNPFYTPKSYHSFGLAVDFMLVKEIIFEWSYYVYQIAKDWSLNGYSVVEFEVVQDKKDQNKYHCHLAIAKGKELQCFTATY